MNRALAENVVERCSEALVTGDVVPLHRAHEAIERYVLARGGRRARGGAMGEAEYDRLRETAPLQKFVQNTFRSIGGR
jgi:hypothetical protein